MSHFKLILFIFFWLIPALSAAGVKAVGLMNGTAILEINGRTSMVKEGQTVNGVKLISANSNEAIIQMNNKRQTLTLGTSVASGYSAPVLDTVRLGRGPQGHYWANGRINGHAIKMLVDTGASHVAISGTLAASLGIDYRKGTRSISSTAAGNVNSFIVLLDKVQVGDIKMFNIKATVIEGDHPAEPLLGMSFLGNLNMSEQNNELLLSQ